MSDVYNQKVKNVVLRTHVKMKNNISFENILHSRTSRGCYVEKKVTFKCYAGIF